jgi:hypothetical protein
MRSSFGPMPTGASVAEPSGLPLVLFLEPRQHFGEPGDLPDDLAAEFGGMISRIDRAILSLGGIERVHILRAVRT